MKYILVVVGFLTASTSFATQLIADLSRGESQVEFFAVGRPSSLKIHGEGGAATGQVRVSETQVSGLLNFPLNTLKTGIKLRDEHMKEKYLQVPQYPTATLKILKMPIPRNLLTTNSNAANIPFEGELTLRGVNKPVTGVASLTRLSNNVTGDVEFKIRIGDFNIKSPSFAGVTVADEVRVVAHFKAPLTRGQ